MIALETRAAALLELRKRRRLPPAPPAILHQRFGSWLAEARPELRWDAAHFLYMQQALDRVTGGEVLRALFNVALRHGKTEHNTISYSAYRLERLQSTRILICTYNDKQAQKLSHEIRQLVIRRAMVSLSRSREALSDWETIAGGGVRAVGAGSGLASINADLIIIDDPIGSRDEAESQAQRDRVWDWITSDVLARCEPHTAVIFSMPRWHQDDPAGRIRDRQPGRWHVVDLPGRAEDNDALGRSPGAPLWPESRGEAWLDGARIDLGEYGFASLIQGRPRPREGGMFKWSWWQLLEAVPAVGPMVRYWDLAGTTPRGSGHDPDYTAGTLACRMPDSRTAIVDVARFRKSVMERDAELERIARADKAAYGGRIRWWIETEAGISGAERTATLVRRLQNCGLVVRTEHPTGKKVLRIEPLASKAEAGNIVLCPGAWRDAFRTEAADFTGVPGGSAHDDQLDSAAGAESKLNVPTDVRTGDFSL